MDLQGSRVIVTGASTGIGRETALMLAEKGATVWGFARDASRLAELKSAGVIPVSGDVSLEADRARLVETVGQVDVLVNNAGLGWDGLVESMPFADVRNLFEINVLGLIDLTLRVLPGMLERARGHIVNVGSVAGFVSAPPATVYSATKFAVAGFTDGLRREVANRGVGVSLIAPGPVKTEFMARVSTGAPAPTPGALDHGVSAASVAKAILRSVTRPGVPGYQVVCVPRVLGAGRLGSAPGVRMLTDLVTRSEVRKRLPR